ncbi:hypothetical protein MTX26_30295 [Bradyrhizobium sp. ISRA443]|uniref:hypothetical protein n=1 Tax=unclassified Bradyrhizobium TaxID=2631580 RepID=UPI002478F74F|nr:MULTISPECIES: hypothetical protein [unclassified Bradyrhizobium]WGR93867.1 hypothetical protein MTX20_05260 [Bradyrhizobium sp. ISRA435]WGR98487.1 hypothetical protein MTX23_30280 [Bradyrhizobium sp. ISRA436]WGS05376.1 hypothetical protein MTX18_30300 [Bradyrhizobium sp. ISRA437]WGS12262.1 hypothetical protein MTX26_30295 [Bradyrhizobium sp. ISRA443]
MEKPTPLAHGQTDILILQALVRRLVMKGVLSPEDVRAMLLDAAKNLDLVGSELTPEAAHIIVQQDLASAFLGTDTSG